MCGASGVGALQQEVFMQRLSGALAGIYGNDLDYIFGNIDFLSRAPSESYDYSALNDMLTSDQWDQVEVADAWYRARITAYFQACQAGGTVDGIRWGIYAALSVDTEVIENWRFIDSYGLPGNFGRAPVTTAWQVVDVTTGWTVPFGIDHAGALAFAAAKAIPSNWDVQEVGPRNEVTVVPHKSSLLPIEWRLATDMIRKFIPIDTILTVNTTGLSVSTPITIRAITADSTYYQVEKVVTAAPVLDQLPAPELLAIDLDPTEQWLFSGSPELAPYAMFNVTSEYCDCYVLAGGARSPIDSVSYGLLQADGVTVVPETPFAIYENTGQLSDYMTYEIADSPDNYPGGQYGIHPATAPALNPDGSDYQFAYPTQQAYIDFKKAEVLAMGGYADDLRYRLVIQVPGTAARIYTADLSYAYSVPARDSTVTSAWTGRHQRTTSAEIADPSSFVRS
jgi:hypothetical protein